MTEHTPAVPAHPSPDELADWRAGLLATDAAADVAAHVESCDACAAEVAALDEVAVLLAEAGAEPMPMPTDVAASLDAALARVSLERAYDVPSLEERRASAAAGSTRSSGRRVRRAVGWLGAAAAVVVVGVLAGQGLGSGGGGGDSSASSAESADNALHGQTAGGSAGAGVDPNAQGLQAYARKLARDLDRRTLPTFATTLTSKESLDSSMTPPHAGGTVRGTAAAGWVCEMAPREPGHIRARVIWNGGHAYVDVNPDAHEVSVYTCGATPTRLYSTTY